MPRIQFLRRCIVETIPTPAEVLRLREEERQRSKEEKGSVAIPSSLLNTWISYYHAPAWYGFERDAIIRVERCYERGCWWLVDLTDNVQARIPLHYAMRYTQSEPRVPEATPHLLSDKLFSAKVDNPALFFRNPEEKGFWKTIVHNPLDDVSRLVYADWLDDHNDPDAWIFRENLLFDTRDFHGLKWDEAAAFLPQPNLSWQNLTIQGSCSQFLDHRYQRHVHYHFADGSHPPQFVAYLLLLMRLQMWMKSLP